MSPSVIRWIRIALVVGVLAAAVVLTAAAGGVLELVVVSALLAYLTDPLVRRLEARGMGRTLASSLVFLSLIVLAVVALVLLLPLAADQVRAIQGAFTAAEAGVLVEDLERRLEGWLAGFGVRELHLADQVQALVQARLGNAFSYVPGVVAVLSDLALIPFFTFFLLKDGPSIRKGFISAVPNRYFELTLSILYKVDAQLGGYLRGQFLAALLVGLLSVIALWALDVPYFVLIGLVSGLANMIPYVGPVAGAVLALLVSLLNAGSAAQALGILVAFTLIQQLDNVILQPFILARNVALHPLMVLLSVVVAGRLFGAFGLLLAVPVAAVLKVALYETVTTLRRYRFA